MSMRSSYEGTLDYRGKFKFTHSSFWSCAGEMSLTVACEEYVSGIYLTVHVGSHESRAMLPPAEPWRWRRW